MDQLFLKIGLNKNEREVYLSVLKAGKIPAHRVAKETGINRTTVYSIAKKLQSMRLISEDLGQKITYLVAENPKNLTGIFEKELTILKTKKEMADKLAEELSKTPSNKQYSVPRIKFIEENDLNKYMRDRYPTWEESMLKNDGTWWGYQDDTFTEQYKKYIDMIWRKSYKKLKSCLFTNKAEIEKRLSLKYKGRGIKTLPGNIEFDSTFVIAGDYIIMVQTRVKPHYLVEMHDPVFARNQRELFKGLWGLVK